LISESIFCWNNSSVVIEGILQSFHLQIYEATLNAYSKLRIVRSYQSGSQRSARSEKVLFFRYKICYLSLVDLA